MNFSSTVISAPPGVDFISIVENTAPKPLNVDRAYPGARGSPESNLGMGWTPRSSEKSRRFRYDFSDKLNQL